MHKYRWFDVDETVVQCVETGAMFGWPKGEDNVRVNIANVNGRPAEQFRLDDGPKNIAPYKEPTEKP